MFRRQDEYAHQRKSLREMRKHVLTGKHNIEEFLHGYCNLYLLHFLDRNPEWTGVVMTRKSNGCIIHAYAEKVCEDGKRIYADARGVFGDEKLFFRPYRFKAGQYERRELTEEDVIEYRNKIQELDLAPAITEAYEMAYED